MKTIQVKVEVFDDPEFCESKADAENYVHCEYSDEENTCCLFFEILVFNYDIIRTVKCDQCKKAYQEGK